MRTISPRSLVLALAVAVGSPAGLAAHPVSSGAGALGAAAIADDVVLVKKGGGKGHGKGHAKGHARAKHAGKHRGHHRVHVVAAPRRVHHGHPAWHYHCHWHAWGRHCHPHGRAHHI